MVAGKTTAGCENVKGILNAFVANYNKLKRKFTNIIFVTVCN